ncbi:MAG: hypothetical protein QM723_30930 [Myxococcaceae bacterium]
MALLASCTDSRTAEVALQGPKTAAPGEMITINVTINDKTGLLYDDYLGKVTFSSDDDSAKLPAPYSFKKEDKGKHAFVVSFTNLGAHLLNAKSETSTGHITITIAQPMQPKAMGFKVVGLADPSMAGQVQDLDVTAVDAMGNPVAGYTGTVGFASTDANAQLPAQYTFTALDSGHHLFSQSVALKTAGSQTVTVTDQADMSLTGAQTVTVTAAQAGSMSFTVNGFPTPATAGAQGMVTLTVKDQFGNVATNYLGRVHLSSSDSQATLLPDYPFIAGDLGVHSFPATLFTAGSQTITITDVADATLTATQNNINVLPGPAKTLLVENYPSPQPAGMMGGFDVTALDAYGNVATGYAKLVHFTSSDPAATLPTDYIFAPADQGKHSFTAAFTQIGVQSLTVTDAADASITGTQANISVTPAGVAAIALTGFPSPSVAGVPGNFTVAVTDAFGNPSLNYAGTVHFTSTDPQAVLPADYTFTAADMGAHVFQGTLATAGTQSLTVADTFTPALTGSQTNILITPAAAASLTVAGFPSPTTAGAAGTFTVTALDAYGNVAVGYLGSIHVTTTDPFATPPADYTFVAADNGVHALSATFKSAGIQTLTATDMTTGFSASQPNIVVTPGAAASLVLNGFPSPTVAGLAGNFSVTAYDAYNNIATGYAGTVHFTSSDLQATLPANYTFVAGDSGAHLFSGTLKTVGSQALTGTDTTTATLTATQGGIIVNPSSGVSFTVAGFPSPVTAGTAGNLTLTVRDTFGNLATGYTGTAHFSSTDPNAQLPADYVFTAGDAGQHVFSATLVTTGTQSISANDSGGASSTQANITVNPAAAAAMTLAGFPSPQVAGVAGNFTVTVRDAYGNLATGYRGTLHFASTDTASTLPTDYTFTAGDAATHTFSANLKTAGVQTITGTDATAGLGASQNNITITPAAASTLQVAGFPSPSTAGVAGTVNVTARDAFGNLATGYRGTVHFSSTDAAATLPTDYAFTAADSGVHAFSLTLRTAGTWSLGAADTVTASIAGSQTGIVVNAAGATNFTVSGFPNPVTAGAAGNFTVTAHDSFGNLATGYRGTVHLTSSDAAATLAVDYAFTAGDNGAHVFSATLRTAATQTLTATDTVQPGITGAQTGIVVNPAAATSLVVAGFPNPVTAGVAGTLTVTARDSFGNLALGYRGTVHFTSTDGTATLAADYAFTAGDNGAHVFSATLKTAGTQSIASTDTATPAITGSQAGIVVNPAAGASMTLAGFASPATAGVAGSFTVTVRDAFGNTATGYRGTLHFTSTDGAASLPVDYAFTAGDNGVHVFSATLRTVGTRALTGTDTANGAITATQSSITVNPAAASTFTVAGFPSPTTAGVAGSVTVTAYDPFGNVATGYRGSAHFTSTDGAATLPADYAFTAGDNGAHTFSATLRTAGTRALTATDTVTAGITGTQSAITVNPGAAASLTAAGFPSTTVAGASGNITVTLFDAFGNVATGYRGTVRFSSSDAAAVLSANYAFTAADNGVHLFTETLRTVGTQSLTATDTANATLTGTQANITVTPAPAASVSVTGFPSPTTAGVSGGFTATVRDAFGNVATGFTGTLHFTSTDGAATLPADYAFTAGDSGVHAFTATLRTVGTRAITATDTTNATVNGTQSGITVNPAAAASLVVSGFPDPVTAGVAGTVTVTARDAFGNTATGYTGTVHFTSTDAQAGLPANYAFVAGDSGAHTFAATLRTAGVQSLTATDTVTASVTGTQANIDVNPAAAASLVVAGYPSPQVAGVSGSFTVTARDAFSNLATGYRGAVHFTSSDTGATLPANYTFTAADNAVHTFNATFATVGTQSLTGTDTVTASVTGTQSSIFVNPAGASSVTVAGFPSPSVAGVAGTFTVTIRDAFGNLATGYRGTMHFTSTDGAATLPADYAFTAADNGAHSFTATLRTAGSRALTATDTVTAALNGTQSGITVTPAAASTLTVAGFPSPSTAGVAGTLTVTARDAFGNVATGYTGTVHFTSTDGTATLPANYGFVAGDAGAHTFSATLRTAGSQTLTATDTVNATLTGAQTVTVNPAAASTLVVAGFPSPQNAGVAGGFTVTMRDAFGNLATGYRGAVHFTSSDTGATLPANYTFTAADNAVHSFTATFATVGTQSLTGTDTVTASITGTQSPITVNPASGTIFTVAGFPSPQVAGVAGTFSLTVKDSFGNVATGYRGTVHFTSTDAQAVLPADYTFTAADSGVHSFTATLRTVGTRVITATDTASAGITGAQGGIVITPAAAASFTVSGFPSPQTAGVAGSFVVTALDAFGNTATGYTGTVHFTSNDAQAVLPANYAFVAGDAGSHGFSATLRTVGARTLVATDTGNATLTGTQSVTVNPAAAASLVVAGFPNPASGGVAGTFTVTARDAFGNTATGYRGTVHVTSSDTAATLPSDYAFTAGDNGVHSFSATLKTVGTWAITTTDTVSPGITGSQTGIVVTPATAASFTVAGYPSPQTAGVAGSFTVTAKDSFGNTATGYTGTVRFTSSDPSATLPANYTFTAGDNGVHTFSSAATFRTVGSQSLVTTDTVSSGITGSQNGIVVNPAAAASFTVAGYPSPQTAGVAGSFTVTARDAFGNVATGYTGTVRFSTTDTNATLPGNTSFLASDLGVRVFTSAATFRTAGAQTLVATDTVNATVTGQQSVTINPAAAANLSVAGYTTPRTAGTAGNFTVTARDAFGNTATGYRGSVHFTSTDGAATLPSDYAFTAGDSGVHVFSATLKSVGTWSLTGTDTANGTVTGTQASIVVNPAGAASFVVAGFPSTVTAGTANTFTVTARDAFGNTATGYTGTVHFTSSDGAATVPANYTFTAADNGAHSFSATLRTAGTGRSLTATDTVTASITGSQTGITVNPGAAASFTVAGYPSPTVAGVSHTFTVTALDAFGNTATGYTGSARFSSTDAAAVLPATYTFVAGDAGAHTFSATLRTTATQSLTAIDTVTTSITGSQTGITVNAGAAASFVAAGLLTPRTAGAVGTLSVTARDAFGNTATGYRGTVHFTSTDAQATLPADYVFTAGDNGAHNFSVTLKTVGTHSVTVTDTVTVSITGSQTNIVVTPAGAATLLVNGITTPRVAGTGGTVTVTARDAYGNTATGYLGTVRYSSTDAQASLPGNGVYTFVAADNGTKSLPLTLYTAGTQSVTATDTVTASINGTQSGIVVTAAAVSALRVSGYPNPATAGVAGTFSTTAIDAYGNTVTGYTGTVHFSSTDQGATLPANYVFTAADNGTHSFSATFRRSGTQQLGAADTNNMALVGSQLFTVNPGPANSFTVAGFPSPVAAGTAASVTVTAYDAFFNIATGYRGTAAFTSSDGSAVLPANYAFTAADSGAHVFTATLRRAGTQSITATDTVTGTLTGTQSGITVTPGAPYAAKSTISCTPNRVLADNASTISCNVHFEDQYANVLAGQAVTWSPSCYSYGSSTYVTCSSETFTGGTSQTLDANGNQTNAMRSSLAQLKYITATVAGVAKSSLAVYLPIQLPHAVVSFYPFNTTTGLNQLGYITSLPDYALARVNLANGSTFALSFDYYVSTGANATGLAYGYTFGAYQWAVAARGANQTDWWNSAGTMTGLTAGTAPVDVTFGDVNGDGNADMVTANRDSNSVSLYFGGTQGGNFGTPVTFSVGTRPRSVSVGHRTDGRGYIAVANEGSDSVSIVLPQIFCGGIACFWTNAGFTYNLPTGAHPMSVMYQTQGTSSSRVLVAEAGLDQVEVLDITTSNTASTVQTIATGIAPASLTMGSYYSNGYQPLLGIGNYINASASILTWNGSSWSSYATYSFNTEMGNVLFADPNFDCADEIFMLGPDGWSQMKIVNFLTSFCPIT